MRLFFSLVTVFAGALVFACSSFSEAEEPLTPDDAAVSVDGGSDHNPPPLPGDDSSVDICSGRPATFEYAGLYIADGYLTDPVSGMMIATATVLRAPLHCDGSLGDFVTQPEVVARAFYGGGAAVIGDVPLLLNGASDTGQNLVGYAFVGVVDGNQTIVSFTPTNPSITPVRWRFAAAATTTNAFMIGGQDGMNSSLPDVTQLTVTFNGSTPTLAAASLPSLPESIVRGSAAIAHNTLIVSGGSKVWGTTVKADGTLEKWSSVSADPTVTGQFDGVAVADGSNVYLIGGESNNSAFSRVDCSQSPPQWYLGAPLAGTGVASAIAAASRGRVYLLREGDTTISIAKLQPDSITLETGSSIPAARIAASIFIR